MPKAWADKRERQYEHIKDGLVEHGRSEDLAEEIAARTVNRERARADGAKVASHTSIDDITTSARAGEAVCVHTRAPEAAHIASSMRTRSAPTWRAARG